MTLMGEILKAGPVNNGTAGQLNGAGPGRGKTGSTKVKPPVLTAPTLADIGISKRESTDAKALAGIKEMVPELHEQVRAAACLSGAVRGR